MNSPSPLAKLVSPGVLLFLRRRLDEGVGLGLVLLGITGLMMLVSYSPKDISAHTVSNIDSDTVRNWLGPNGANAAGWLVAALGLPTALLLAFIPISWGMRLLRHAPLAYKRWRLLLLPPVLLLLAAITSMLAGDFHGGAAARLILQPLEPLLQTPITGLPAALEMITAWHVGFVLMILLAIPGYCWVAAIGRDALGILPRLLWPLHRLILAITGLIGRTTTSGKAADKSAGRQRKAPKPRREPVLVTTAAAETETADTATRSRRKTAAARQGKLDLESQAGYRLPPLNLLADPNPQLAKPDATVLDNNSRLLEGVLGDFGIRGEIEQARFGPVVTRYELNPAPGTKTQRVIGLADDIARQMAALSVRVAVVPGQNVIGVEMPNADRQTVLLRDILDHDSWQLRKVALPVALGMDIAGNPVVTDLARMPHLLVAGTTGSGKSVGINGMILSLLYTHTPEQCRLIMVDPKMLELSVYDGIPHLLTPVVTDPGKAVVALKWAVREMETRYRNMAKLGVRNIQGYNQRLAEARRKGEALSRRVQTGFDAETGKPLIEDQPLDLTDLPFIVIIIDEVADLMLVAGKDIEAAVQRLAQMARAAGIHVIMATQRPSVDVITGTIKANFPTRISFQVTSKIDSRTILGEQGAEQLLGRGDMLFMEGGGRITRVHGPFVSDEEVEAVANFLRQQGEPEYDERVTIEESDDSPVAGVAGSGGIGDAGGGDDASLYEQAVQLVRREGRASTSFIQRHLRIGYNRAATIIEEMERRGIVSPANHAGKREVLLDEDQQ